MGHVAVHGHLPGWASTPDAKIVAAADAREDHRDALLEVFPDARWHRSAEELLAGNHSLDFVDICAPSASHALLARAALERGLHVLCEKPLALSTAELRPLADAAKRAGRALVTVHNWNHAPAVEEIAGLLGSGAIGSARRGQWETHRTRPAVAGSAGDTANWRTGAPEEGGGILLDHGWHAIYILFDWLGREPRSVTARLTNRRAESARAEDTAEVSIELEGGGTAELFLTWSAGERANRARVSGTAGELALDGGRLVLERPGAREERSVPSLAEGSHHPDWFGGVVRGFLGEVRDPARRGRNLAEASRCVAVIEAARASSARDGAAVAVERGR